ncbi:hypothetical protein ABT095_14970 [Kitasatospora sp. NPDC002227]|uniref:hypothetical protein n=1 Tax=Kitasatospora sp. NPDC002227 TaxID=3154773 RepID=UPI0033277DD4
MPASASTAVVTDFDGTRRTMHLSAPEADALIATALLFDDATVTAGGDRRGTLTITRVLATPAGTATHTVTLEPPGPQRPPDRQHEDLVVLAGWKKHYPGQRGPGHRTRPRPQPPTAPGPGAAHPAARPRR